MTRSRSHLLVVLMVAVGCLCSLSRPRGAVALDTRPGEEGGRRAVETEKQRCVAFRVGGLMKTKSGAT